MFRPSLSDVQLSGACTHTGTRGDKEVTSRWQGQLSGTLIHAVHSLPRVLHSDTLYQGSPDKLKVSCRTGGRFLLPDY